jgi:membrane fusion protein, multidrug efflux system
MSKLEQLDPRSTTAAPDGMVAPIVARAVGQASAPFARDQRPQAREARSAAPAAPASDTTPQDRPIEKTGLWNRSRLRLLLMIGGVVGIAVVAGVIWLRGGRYVSTGDAYVQAARLMVSTDVSGIVSSVDVHENQVVKAGDVLFRIDPRQFQIALDNANANLAQMALTIESMKEDYKVLLSNVAAQEAQVGLDEANYNRYAALLQSDAVSEANYDQARFTLAADKNKLESLRQQAAVQLAKLAGNADIPVTQHPEYKQAKAVVDEAQRQLDHSAVHAPFNGVVTQVDTLQPGTYLVSQTAALTNSGAVGLVSTDDIWIDASMKETDLTYVKPGDHVDVSVDTYPGEVWSGTVQSISPASDSEFSILPPQNASGNWVKVVQRIPVRIGIDQKSGHLPLRAGMSVTANIDTGHHRTLSDLL